MTRRRAGERGFTLIELMIALLVSSLLVGMILAIFSRMSLAYRGQQQIAGVQQVLAAARATVELDAKQAGFGMSQGFTTAITGATVQSPVQVVDRNDGPDQIAFFYADANTQALVTDLAGWPAAPSVTVDAAAAFVPETLVVLSTVSTTPNPADGNRPQLASYTACVLRIAPGGVGANTLTFSAVAPWGAGGAAHCQTVPVPNKTMVYALVAHAYQIDTSTPERAALGLLQQSSTGGLLGANEVWKDLAYGFTDIQTAVRVWETPIGNPDGDDDVNRDWYSGPNQGTLNTVPPGAPTPANASLQQMSISLVARTDRDIEGISTPQTPTLIVAGRDDNNATGNRPSLPLPRPGDPALQGSRIYRYVTFQVDFRNLGVGL